MLQIIEGLSGYGKTQFIWRHILNGHGNNNCNDIGYQDMSGIGKNSKKVMVLVPEQFSFEAEKMLCDYISNNGINNNVKIEVLNFKRLCNVIFREYGGLTKNVLSSAKSNMLVYLALMEIKDKLEVYKKQVNNHSFYKDILSIISVLKNNNISCQRLKLIVDSIDINKNINNKLLKAKLMDIYLIYQSFEEKIDNSCIDSDDIIHLAFRKLKNKNFFKDYIVYIDSFTFFTESQYSMLEHMILESDAVYLSLCLDGKIHSSNSNGNIFLNQVLKTKKRFLQIAQDNKIPVLKPICLTEPYRFQNESLITLENDIYKLLSNDKVDHNFDWSDQSDFEITECKTINQEIEFVASEISHLVKEKNFRFNQIIVIARDIKLYRQSIQNIFRLYDIPYFLDEKKPIKNESLIIFIKFLLEAAVQNFQTLSILKLLKTGFLDIDQDQISKLEIYCGIWNIDKNLWLSEFSFNPRGFGYDLTEEDKVALDELNLTREKIVDLLENLKQKTERKHTVNNFIKILYTYLVDINIFEKISQIIKDSAKSQRKVSDVDDLSRGYQTQNEEAFFLQEEFGKVWESFIDIMDDISDLVGEKNISLKEFINYFDVALSNFDVSFLPQTLDQVLVGQADHLIVSQVKVVFVVGLNQGVFPLTSKNFLIFTEKENNILLNAGINLSGSKIDYLLNERYYFYKSVTSASHRVYLSYHKNSVERSFFVTQLEKSFFNLKIKKFDENNLKLIQNKSTAYGFFCKDITSLKTIQISEDLKSSRYCKNQNQFYSLDYELNNSFVLVNSIVKYLETDFVFAQKIKKIRKIIEFSKMNGNFNVFDKNLLKNYLHNKLSLSPSSIERFQICKFKFFCNDILKIRKTQRVSFSKLQQGVVIHYILKELLETQKLHNLDNVDLSHENIKKQIQEIFDRYLYQVFGGNIVLDTRSNYLDYISRQIIVNIGKVFDYVSAEQASSQFKANNFELEISEKSDVKPWKFQLKSGERVSICGKVDRVDFCQVDNFNYIRVIDYKSGNKNFSLDDVYHGLNMQMLLYLFAIINSYRQKKIKIDPAGVLYLSIEDKVTYVQRDTLSKQSYQELNFDNFKMSGILLNDVNVLSLMEKNLEGKFIPAKVNKDSTLSKTSSVLGEEDFNLIEKHIENVIILMAECVFNGNVVPVPIDSSRYKDVCRYCDYKFICGLGEDKMLNTLNKPPNDWYKKYDIKN